MTTLIASARVGPHGRALAATARPLDARRCPRSATPSGSSPSLTASWRIEQLGIFLKLHYTPGEPDPARPDDYRSRPPRDGSGDTKEVVAAVFTSLTDVAADAIVKEVF